MGGDQRAWRLVGVLFALVTVVLGCPSVSCAQAPSSFLGSVPTGQATRNAIADT